MEITLPISSFIIIAIGSVGVVVAMVMGILLLAQKSKPHISIGLLAGLLILSALTLLNNLLVTSGISNRVQQLYFIPIYYSLSIPPLFYLFIKSKFNYRLAASDLLHLIVPAIQALVYWSIGFRSVAFKSELYDQEAFRIYLSVESVLFPISLLGYSLWALMLLRRKNSTDFFWTDDLKKWLKQFAIGMLSIAVMEFGLFLLEGATISSSEVPFYLGQTFILSAFAFWMAINGFRQYYPLQIFTSKPSQNASLMDQQELAQLVEDLQRLMRQDKVFLNPDLNLQLLAQYLGGSTKRCSYVLNTGMGANFNQYINRLRVDAFKERIQQGQHQAFTLTSIAYECGFDSKSTFNRVFKANCGMTPSEFVNRTQGTT